MPRFWQEVLKGWVELAGLGSPASSGSLLLDALADLDGSGEFIRNGETEITNLDGAPEEELQVSARSPATTIGISHGSSGISAPFLPGANQR